MDLPLGDDAVLDSSGTFTLDPRIAAEKYGKLFHRVEEAALYCISTLVAGGATLLTWETRPDGWRCRITGCAPLPADTDPFWTAWERGMPYFAAQGYSALHVRQGSRIRTYKGQEPGPPQHDDVEWVCAGGSLRLNEEYLGAHLLYATFQVEGLPRSQWTHFLPKEFVVPSRLNGSNQLLAEAQRWERGSVGLRDVTYPDVRFRLPSGRSARTACVAHVLVAEGLNGQSELRVIQHGVALQALPWPEAPGGICAVVQAPGDGLATDLSGRKPIAGEALEACRWLAVQAALPAVSLAALRSREKGLSRRRRRLALGRKPGDATLDVVVGTAGAAVLLVGKVVVGGATGGVVAGIGLAMGLLSKYIHLEPMDTIDPAEDQALREAESWFRQQSWQLEKPKSKG
jgi:hypothetical protein